MDVVLVDRVATEVLDAVDGQNLAVDLDFVALHDLLHRLADVTQPHVDPGSLDALCSGFLRRLQQVLVHRVEGYREGGVNQKAVDMSPEV